MFERGFERIEGVIRKSFYDRISCQNVTKFSSSFDEFEKGEEKERNSFFYTWSFVTKRIDSLGLKISENQWKSIRIGDTGSYPGHPPGCPLGAPWVRPSRWAVLVSPSGFPQVALWGTLGHPGSDPQDGMGESPTRNDDRGGLR